jgi:hypothetical protein
MVTTEAKVSHKPLQNHQPTICGFIILRVENGNGEQEIGK